MSMRRTVGGIGALLTCPCHAVPLLLLVGGTAGSAWLARYLPIAIVALGALFLASLWLLTRPERDGTNTAVASTCANCDPGKPDAAPGRDDVLRRS